MTTESELTLISNCSSPDIDFSKDSTLDTNDLSRISDYSDSLSKDYSSLSDSDDVFSDIAQSPISLINPTKLPFNIPTTSSHQQRSNEYEQRVHTSNNTPNSNDYQPFNYQQITSPCSPLSSSRSSSSLSDNNFSCSDYDTIASLTSDHETDRCCTCSPGDNHVVLTRDDHVVLTRDSHEISPRDYEILSFNGPVISLFDRQRESANQSSNSSETVVSRPEQPVCGRTQHTPIYGSQGRNSSRETITNHPTVPDRRRNNPYNIVERRAHNPLVDRRVSSSVGDIRNNPRLSYVARALALARPTSPPPPYGCDNNYTNPTVLTLASYFGFTQVGNRPHSAPNHRPRPVTGPNYDPGDMTNEPYTLQATHVLQLVPNSNSENAVNNSDGRVATPDPRVTSPDPRIQASSSSVFLPNSPLSRRQGTEGIFGVDALDRHICSRGDAEQRQYFRLQNDTMFEVSTVVTPPLIVDTRSCEEMIPPPPYTAGDWTDILRAPRYSEVVNPHYIRHNRIFGRNSAFACMGSVRTLAIGITLCCCGVVFLMVTYVFGAVTNIYLGYLGVLQVFIGMTMIFLVAVYNSGRWDFANFVKRTRVCSCLLPDHSPSPITRC